MSLVCGLLCWAVGRSPIPEVPEAHVWWERWQCPAAGLHLLWQDCSADRGILPKCSLIWLCSLGCHHLGGFCQKTTSKLSKWKDLELGQMLVHTSSWVTSSIRAKTGEGSLATAKWTSLAWFFTPHLFLAGLHWKNEKSERWEMPQNTTGDAAALGMALAFQEAAGTWLHGQWLWKLPCFSLTDCAEICSLGKMPCWRCWGKDCKLLVWF